MSDMFLVQDDLPLPAIDRRPKNPRRKWPAQDMAPGQSFFLPGKYAVRGAWCRNVGKTERWEVCDAGAGGAVHGVIVQRTE